MRPHQYTISLGSNQGDRLKNLTTAFYKIKTLGHLLATSPTFENAPLLPADSPQSWYHFFLNAIILLESHLTPPQLLQELQNIECALGRHPDHAKWSPRTIDLDIIFCDGEALNSPELKIPHPQWEQRAFVTTPLFHLSHPCSYRYHQAHRQQKQKLATLMGVVNVTPDSFSQKTNSLQLEQILSHLKDSLQIGVGYLDIGAESTRPGATPLSAQEELDRLAPLFEIFPQLKNDFPFTHFSIDTYHPETAKRALQMGFDVLNDVNGLKDPRMQNIAQDFRSCVLMHSLTVPADSHQILPADTSIVEHLQSWLQSQLSLLRLPKEKVIFDPGIGFGLTPLQSLKILQSIQQFTQGSLRVLVGHSRKSFLSLWTDKPAADRDAETLMTSSFLIEQGVDILRVHNIELHQRSMRSHYALRST